MNEGEAILKEMEETNSSPRDLAEQQITKVREWLNGDLFAFSTVIFNYRDLIPPLHGEVAAWIGNWGKPGYERIGVQIPREFFKTSLCTRGNALWQLCREPNKPVIIFNERMENVAKWIKAIQDVVQGSHLFQTIYRDMMPPGMCYDDPRNTPRYWVWSGDKMNFEGRDLGEAEHSLSGSGMEAAVTGGHWPKMIIDDPISFKHEQSPSEMETAREWVENHVYLMRPAEDGMALVVDTPWRYGDINDDFIKRYGYRFYRRSALEINELGREVSIFPAKLSTQKLKKMRKRDPYKFSSQMMCKPKPGKETAFQEDWFRTGKIVEEYDEPCFLIDQEHYDEEITEIEGELAPRLTPLHEMELCVLVDPAPSDPKDIKAEPGSRNAALLNGVDCHGRRYKLDSLLAREDPLDSLRSWIELCMKWNCDRIAIEEVTFSKLYKPFLGYILQKEYDSFPIQVLPLKPAGRSKDMRIRARITPMRTGFLYFNVSTSDEILQEYRDFPYGATRDAIDADAYEEDVLQRPVSTRDRQMMLGRERDRQTGSDPVTGY